MSQIKQFSVRCCGSNGSGQLGIGNVDDLLGIQQSNTIFFNSKPTKICCGGNHTLILCDNGSVFASGANLGGLIEESDFRAQDFTFQMVSFNGVSKFKNIACGWEFSILVANDNSIYVHGEGLNGELGLGKEHKRVKFPRKLIFDFNGKSIKDIQASIHSVILQLENNELWGWGNNKRGQLLDFGVDKSLKVLWKPTKLEFENTVSKWSMGREFTVFITIDGKLIMKGRDSFGIEMAIKNDASINIDQIQSLLTMWSSLHIKLLDSKSLTSLGNNSHGQKFPSTKEMMDDFAVGSEHGLCFNEKDNTVFAWGWGEHGNCGLQHGKSNIEQVTFDFLNPIYKLENNEELVALFGGCATSWIVTTNKD